MAAPMTARHPVAPAPEATARLHRALIAERAMLEQQVEELTMALDDLTEEHEGDNGVSRALAERGHEHAVESIAAVDEALARMAAGTYGVCVVCDGAIAWARLEAMPATPTCVLCSASRPSFGLLR